MRRRIGLHFVVAGAMVVAANRPTSTRAQAAPPAPAPSTPPTPSTPPATGASGVPRGQAVYARYCATCHGDGGQGDGPTARLLGIAPRNFVLGQYRFRSTPSGTLPTDEDLVRTITWGLPGTEMPAWGGLLPESDIRAVVARLKAFSPRFVEEESSRPVPLPPVGAADGATLDKGRTAWTKMKCALCHGETGRGDGPSMVGLRDEEGRPLPAADLTRRLYKGGWQPADVMRDLETGLDGAAMPAYAATMPDDETAALVHFVLSLRRPAGVLDWLGEAPR